jgi:hypothetical protein
LDSRKELIAEAVKDLIGDRMPGNPEGRTEFSSAEVLD